MTKIDWDSPTWGDPETCVHIAADGSFVGDAKHNDAAVD